MPVRAMDTLSGRANGFLLTIGLIVLDTGVNDFALNPRALRPYGRPPVHQLQSMIAELVRAGLLVKARPTRRGAANRWRANWLGVDR